MSARHAAACGLLTLLAACGGGGQELALPAGAAGLPAATVAAAVGLDPGVEAQVATLADSFGMTAGSTLGDPGISYVSVNGMQVGWEGFGDSPNFRSAFAVRPARERHAGWVFVDLQLAVDHLLAFSADGSVRALVEPLGLGALEWAMFSYPLPLGAAREVDGLVRVGDDPVSLARALSGRASPSLLGAVSEGAVLRLELRCDAAVVGRMLDASTEPGALGAGLAARGALLGLAGQLGRTFLREIDGTVSIAVFADETLCAAVGVREPDDVRDLLDRYSKPVGGDVWEGPGGARLEVAGQVLRFATRPWPDGSSAPGQEFGPGLVFEGVPGDALGAVFDGQGVRVSVSPADPATLAVSVRALD